MNRNARIAKQLLKLAKGLLEDTNITITTDGKSDYSMWYDEFAKNPVSDEVQEDDKKDREQNHLDFAENKGKKYILYRKEGDLWRIRACKDFGDVKKGDMGGFVESEENLSQKGECWVADNALIADNAWIADDAQVYGNAKVYDSAKVYGNAWVYGDVEVSENAWVYGDAKVSDGAWVYGDAEVAGNAKVDHDVSEGIVTQ